MSYRIRAYEPGDREAVAGLFKRLWTKDAAVNERYLAWRYERNPYLGPLLAVCECDGTIVAVRGAHGMRWRVADSAVLMPCLGDTVVHDRHEGRGLVQKLTRWLLEELSGRGIDWVVNQSPGPLVEKISLRTGWRKAGEWTVAHSLGKGRRGAGAFADFDISSAEPVDRNGVRISSGSADPGELAVLADQVAGKSIGHVRDEAYFRWRFENPLADYRWVLARGERLAGYLVLGVAAQRRRCVRILDLQGDGGLVQSLLVDQALAWGDFREVRVWWNRFPRQVSKTLADRGFVGADVDGRRRSMILVAPTRRSVDDFHLAGVDLLSSVSWDPRMIHSDAT